MPHYRLLELGIQSIVVNPADVPTTGKEKVQKNDSRDSKKIARSLKNGELTPIYIPSLETLADRSLVRLRKTIARDLARTKTQIKSFLHFNGIDIPEDLSKEKWTRKFVKWLAEVEIGFFRETLEGHLAKYYYFHGLKLDVNRKVKALSYALLATGFISF
ncbi:IS110 family transposase [Autumnicola musiva]|uniref:Transposase n=1 Tax=Autumnicola musiva TaxID=3075589 RepID=A0ABU3D4X3_9FLAO|nr:transposase [Zunongwangia sp. F117]MDT0676589.1 transposase [Zunongwangia sp. F117]